MSIHKCRVRVDGCTSLQLSGLFVLPDELLQNLTHLPEVWLARTILDNLLTKELISSSHIDHIYTVASLPRAYPQLLTHKALSHTGFSAGHVVELGNNCASILDALILCASLTESGSNAIVLCADAFKTTYKANQENSSWLDGGAAIVFGYGDIKLSIESYVTANDHEYSNLCSFTTVDGTPLLGLLSSSEFLEKDLQTEIEISTEALQAASSQWKDIQGYVIINRSEVRIKKLKEFLNPLGVTLYQSRGNFGHRGGSDLIENLKTAIAANYEFDSFRLMLVGNGLGYTWSAMVIRLDRVPNA